MKTYHILNDKNEPIETTSIMEVLQFVMSGRARLRTEEVPGWGSLVLAINPCGDEDFYEVAALPLEEQQRMIKELSAGLVNAVNGIRDDTGLKSAEKFFTKHTTLESAHMDFERWLLKIRVPEGHYRCAGCGKVNKKTNTDEELLAEFEQNFGRKPNEFEMAHRCCDDCHGKMRDMQAETVHKLEKMLEDAKKGNCCIHKQTL